MCGICGVCDTVRDEKIHADILKRMNATLVHRGPDDEGYYISSGIGLAHRRLSIIDLQTGHQPIGNESGRIQVIFNGEIYNFIELKESLIALGHTFKTTTDTEVIVHLYEEYGLDCVTRLRGMFAFALWDEDCRRLFIARDRIGKKPLYYYAKNSLFIFASEIKALLAHPAVPVSVNHDAIHYYLTFQYIPGPLTAFQDIYKLPPASYMVINKKGESRIVRYWNLSFAQKRMCSKDDYKELIRSKLNESTRLRMISDVPLGAFLSGGIDSSIIVGIMSMLSSKPVKTFSIGFPAKGYDETAYARTAAKRFQTEHHELSVTPDAVSVIPRLVWHYDQPFADVSAMPSFYLAQETRKYVTVALNGDGGDENYAGYERYKAHMILHYYLYGKLPSVVRHHVLPAIAGLFPCAHDRRNIWKRIKRFINAAALTPQERNFMLVAYFKPEELASMYTPSFRSSVEGINVYGYLDDAYRRAGSDDLLDQLQYADFMTYLPEDLMVKMDVATMSHSLETRSPFLDHELVELNATIPSVYKIDRRLVCKSILKESFKEMLPPAILHRGKMGFGVPVSAWFRKELRAYITEILLSEKALNRNIIKPECIKRMIDDHVQARDDHGDKLWVLLMLEMWFKIFIDKEKM